MAHPGVVFKCTIRTDAACSLRFKGHDPTMEPPVLVLVCNNHSWHMRYDGSGEPETTDRESEPDER